MKNIFSPLLKLSYGIITLMLLVTLKPIEHTNEGRLYNFKKQSLLEGTKTAQSCFASNSSNNSVNCLMDSDKAQDRLLSIY